MSDAPTRPYAEVIGDPIAHSKSPMIHRFWIEQLGLDADYHAQHVTPDGLSDYFQARRQDKNWRGCNITMPHKQAAMGLVDELEPDAKAIGAINTAYRRDDGALVGTNTDAGGFLEPLRGVLAAQHLFRMARIIGTGGAARAIITALAGHGFTLVVTGRSEAKARGLLSELAPNGEHYAAPLGYFAQTTDFAFDDREGCLDLVVNASPLGMAGNPPLNFDISHAPPGSIFYDIVTDPRETPFLRDAKSGGFVIIGGMEMLVGQAAIAFEKFFGQLPARNADAELLERLNG